LSYLRMHRVCKNHQHRTHPQRQIEIVGYLNIHQRLHDMVIAVISRIPEGSRSREPLSAFWKCPLFLEVLITRAICNLMKTASPMVALILRMWTADHRNSTAYPDISRFCHLQTGSPSAFSLHSQTIARPVRFCISSSAVSGHSGLHAVVIMSAGCVCTVATLN
jgi:hypothetical protein